MFTKKMKPNFLEDRLSESDLLCLKRALQNRLNSTKETPLGSQYIYNEQNYIKTLIHKIETKLLTF